MQEDGRRTAPLIFGAGASWLTSNGYDPTWGAALDAEFGVTRYVSIAASAVLPLSTATLGSPGAEAGARTMSLGVGFVVPLLPPDSLLVPRVGGGTGLVWMHTQALENASTSTVREQDLTSPMFYGDAAVSLRIYGRARLVLAGTLAATTSQMVVRVNDVEQGRFGWPIAITRLGLEAQL